MKALSIRQPWAWLIIHGGKDVENRYWTSTFRGPVLIHASGTMTDDDYHRATHVAGIINPPLRLPLPQDLHKGGIIGQVEIVDCVAISKSRWFDGPYAFVLANPKPLEFRPCKGQLKFFEPEYFDRR